jgi:predicted nuclease with TOPRIM domain
MVCDRHDEIAGQLEDHEERIRDLEIDNGRICEKLISLTESVKDLVWWLKVFIVGIVGVGASFLIWYIQSLPK